jgi:hypothetical protein
MLPSTFLVTNLNDSGAGSLRAAIVHANRDTANPNPDEIDFKLGGIAPYTVNLKSELPIIKHPVFLNGGSQPGYGGSPLVTLSGSTITGGGDGIVLDARGYGHAFAAEVLGLNLQGFGDGIKVLDSLSSTPLNVQLVGNSVTLTSGGDGIFVQAGTGANSVQVSNNRINVSRGGDGITAVTAGLSSGFSFSGNTINTAGGGQGIRTSGAGSSNTLAYMNNTIVTHNGGTALGLAVSPASPTAVTVTGNGLHTSGVGVGLAMSGGPSYQALVQGNSFTSDRVGVKVVGNGTTAGTVDLGGGALGSTGGNDFTGFTTATAGSYAIGLFQVSTGYTMSATGNLFGVADPTTVIADGTHDRAAGGSGIIVV